jgi:hypothetical protein
MGGFTVAFQECPAHFSSVAAKILRNISRIGSVRHVRRYLVTRTLMIVEIINIVI